MKALIVHNSDEVIACFTGETEEEILEKLKKSEHWEDIINRLSDEEFIDNFEGNKPNNITMDNVTDLFHDGDSEDGYTLIDAI